MIILEFAEDDVWFSGYPLGRKQVFHCDSGSTRKNNNHGMWSLKFLSLVIAFSRMAIFMG